MQYNGGKNGSGTYQTIINQIPECDIYSEWFAGSAAICRFMKPAATSILIDKSSRQVSVLKKGFSRSTIILNVDAISSLEILTTFFSLLEQLGKKVFVYLDPPYLMSSRSYQKKIYDHEMSEEDHNKLLTAVSCCTFPIMISAYKNSLYDEKLKHWRRLEYQSVVRGGTRMESLYMNYPLPDRLQDYSFLGADYRERYANKLALDNMVSKLKSWPAPLFNALMHQINSDG